MTDTVGPDLFYICARCKRHMSPAHPFNRDAENFAGRKSCHWCGDNTTAYLDVVNGRQHAKNK